MNQYKEMHKFRCGKCGIFFEIKEEMDDHFRICEKNELKDNKNKYSEFVFHDGEITPIQNSNKEQNISQKKKLKENYDIIIKNNDYENPLNRKYKNQDEKEMIKEQIKLKNDDDIFEKILLKSKENMDKQTKLKLRKEMKNQKKKKVRKKRRIKEKEGFKKAKKLF